MIEQELDRTSDGAGAAEAPADQPATSPEEPFRGRGMTRPPRVRTQSGR